MMGIVHLLVKLVMITWVCSNSLGPVFYLKSLKTNYIPHIQTVGEKSKSTYKLDHVQHGPSLSRGGGGGGIMPPRSR